MSANGLLGSLNFPSLPGFAGRLFAALDDKDAALAFCRAYNDWHIEEWCGFAPERFIPLAIPPIWDPDAIADEVRRVAAKGCHAITFPENPVPLGLPSLHSDHWDPFWKACNDLGTVVCMHIGSSGKLAITAPDAPIDVLINLQPMNIVQAAADVLFSPMIRKFPDVTIALSEGGIGWIPYFLERIDHTYKVHKAWTFADFGGKLPSEVFMERMILCFIEDDFGAASARDRHRSHLHRDRLPAQRRGVAERARAHDGGVRADRSHRPRDQPDHAPQRDEVLPVRPVLDPPARSARPARCAEAVGHDISIVAKGRRVEHDEPTRVRRLRRVTSNHDHVRHNRKFWDYDADDYQAAHGDYLTRHPLAWGGFRGRSPSSRCSATCAARTCSSSGAAAGSGRSRSRRSARVRSASTCRARSSGMPVPRRRRCRCSLPMPSSCPSPTPAFDVVFCDHGAELLRPGATAPGGRPRAPRRRAARVLRRDAAAVPHLEHREGQAVTAPAPHLRRPRPHRLRRRDLRLGASALHLDPPAAHARLRHRRSHRAAAPARTHHDLRVRARGIGLIVGRPSGSGRRRTEAGAANP